MIGQRLGGRYEIKSRVGGGGMAIVYSGHDLLLDRVVAIKILHPQFGTDDDFIRRFRREAQAAAKLTHPNVVNIYDVGQEEDTHYIVMEYVEGETLKDLINREGPLPTTRAVNIAIQITEALTIAHQYQIIHRDIKPHNILIGNNGVVKVTDFGIARAVTSATITQAGSVLGSVHYFSPEQAKGGLTGEKSDIYSLGVVLYEMVTGELPFSGESPISVALKHVQENFKDPKLINPNIPQSVENIIIKSLSKDPELRYQSAKEMANDLKTCLDTSRAFESKFNPIENGHREEATIVIPAIRDGVPAPTYQEYEDDDDMENRKRSAVRIWINVFVWLAILAMLIGLGFYLVKQVQSMFEVPEVATPKLEGLSVEEAISELEDNSLIPKIIEIYHESVSEGNVIKQDPREGIRIKSGTEVALTISLGKETKPMPDVLNKRIREAEAILIADGFSNIQITYDYNEDIPADSVILQKPEGLSPVVPKDTIVTLVVSQGGETFPMPSLIGMTLEQVRATIMKNELELNPNIMEKQSYFLKGIVLSQWPVQAGEQVSKGTSITVEVSSGLKDDARIVPYEVPIIIEEGKETLVEIRISDARYTDRTVIQELVRDTKPFNLEVILSPNRNATITIYEDGIEVARDRITYDEIMEDD